MTCIRIPGGIVCVGISYIAEQEEAARRYRRGERQRQCVKCSRWYWPNDGRCHWCAEEVNTTSASGGGEQEG